MKWTYRKTEKLPKMLVFCWFRLLNFSFLGFGFSKVKSWFRFRQRHR